jgi:DNA-binding NtrC family response regulator
VSARLLVIDDAEDVAILVRAALARTEMGDVQVVPALDAATARREAALGADAVLCDVRLPEVDGRDLVRELRAAGLSAPVTLMSALPEAIRATDRTVLDKRALLEAVPEAVRRMLDPATQGGAADR